MVATTSFLCFWIALRTYRLIENFLLFFCFSLVSPLEGCLRQHSCLSRVLSLLISFQSLGVDLRQFPFHQFLFSLFRLLCMYCNLVCFGNSTFSLCMRSFSFSCAAVINSICVIRGEWRCVLFGIFPFETLQCHACCLGDSSFVRLETSAVAFPGIDLSFLLLHTKGNMSRLCDCFP